MTEQTAARHLDSSTPSPARMYDYYLGGKDNFQVDRDAAEAVLAVSPHIRMAIRGSREDAGRMVRHVVESGVRQIIELGSGLPTRRNVHEVAHEVDPAVRVVYVDHDPVVVAHGQALLAIPERVAMVQADMLDPEQVLEHAGVRRLVNLDEPVAVMLTLVLHLLPDEAGPQEAVARYRSALAPGSVLGISHAAAEAHVEQGVPIGSVLRGAGAHFAPRTREQVLEFFGDFELVPPGLVSRWPYTEPPAGAEPVPAGMGWSGVGVKRG